MTRIGIVGAGVAAAAAADTIETTHEDASITVFEKSRGLCGRAATRRRDGIRYDYGANYVKSADDRVVDLLTETLETDGLVDITEPVWTFDSEGSVSAGRAADEHKWTYRTGLTQIAKRLFGRTDATIHRETRIETLQRDDDAWRLEDTDGDQWGPFDVVLLNPPAPQTADLLRSAEWDSDRRGPLLEAVDAVPYRTIWTGVLHYPFDLEVPYYALVNTDKAHEIGWISREECKPGHVPDGESLLIVQANHEWSVDHYDADPDANLEALAELSADVLDDERLLEPDWTDHQGWRYAQPEAAVDREPLREAEAEGLYCLGDWVAGEARVHAALRNGLEVGERVVSDE
ncbi:NAD(P)/FAD-dependent oxidoreductase [Natronorubrum bangense]|uniref:NAD/FAD-dependent oxidoreductase-like protein n=2 Tax=Natronorubrum bangense TaxID=61858 RepID=L9WTE3_9EURY|nr:NAD(P)-binding protein [Natronorubrum bangense]ELY52744.1 NAD/FAD-dependent oxidoreductase-like protein [Natronorubrum bangense JCM 10635]QCC55195.1 NAD/FAD-dependent oxidoreductase [Natronorubrum bangense]